jgi:hypothetical protein
MLIDFSVCSKLIEIAHGVKVEKIFHVGAHEGEEAIIYSQNMVSHVIWFEANFSLIDKLKRNLENFKMVQYIVPCALFDMDTTIDFHIANNGQSSSLYKLEKHAEYYPNILVDKSEKIKAYRLDTLIDSSERKLPWHDFQFINIDTQGAELSILKGLGSFIDMPSIKGIYLEINSEPLYRDIPLVAEIDSFLAIHGFFRVLTKWMPGHGWGDGFYLKSREL